MNSMDKLKEIISEVYEKENQNYLNSQITLEDVNSCLKVLHHLKKDKQSVQKEIKSLESLIKELYLNELANKYNKEKMINGKLSQDLTEYHNNLRPERKNMKLPMDYL